MPLFNPWQWWQARRKQKRLDEAYWKALYRTPPDLAELADLLDAGADVNGGSRKDALRFALINSTVETVQLLIEKGADIHGEPQLGFWTPILAASQSTRGSDEQKVSLLIEAGADITAWQTWDNIEGRTVLWELTAWANINLIEDVLRRGANPNVGGLDTLKPLHLAAHEGRAEVVALYLRYGADPMARDKEGRTPRMFAEESCFRAALASNKSYIPPYVVDSDECIRLLLAAEQENKG